MKDKNKRLILDGIKHMINKQKIIDPYFKHDDYRIIIGYEIANALIESIYVYSDHLNEMKTLYGIKCSVDAFNAYTVEITKIQTSKDFSLIFYMDEWKELE